MATIAGGTHMENLIDNLPKAIGAVVRHARLGKGMRQVDLAEASDLSQSAISSIEKGASQTTENMCKVALALGMKYSVIVASAERLEEASEGLRSLTANLITAADALNPSEIEDLFDKAIKSERF